MLRTPYNITIHFGVIGYLDCILEWAIRQLPQFRK